MIRGRSWGFRVIVAFYVLCFLTVVPTYGYEPHPIVYMTGLLFPLLGLLLLNSKRHREMRSKLVDIRRQRALIIQAAKASRPRR
ncbi:hypothetical protein PHLH4_53590 [Pseudomonas sp. St316]|nr:hypothetical protein PHLH4_53590 [Pseudomonas sp. St316]